jgi:MurNAc alpha-1-phosphate uridylyltransferase
MQAMILAAGLGSRMQPLTDNLPKPLLKVGKYTLIEHQLIKLRNAGVNKVVINHSYLGHMIEAHLGNGSRLGLEIVYSPEDERLETGGGIINALSKFEGESFIVVNADVWTNFDCNLLPKIEPQVDLAHLVLISHAPHNPSGDFYLSAAGRVQEVATDQMTKFTFAGVSVMHPNLFADLNANPQPLLPILSSAIGRGLVGGQIHQGTWLDVGTPERLKKLRLSVEGAHGYK